MALQAFPMRNRIERINKLIRTELNRAFLQELHIKSGVITTIAKVDTTPDLRNCHVSISVFPENEREYIKKTLDRELYQLQGALNRRIHLAPLPRISFLIDTTETAADEVEKLLRDIREEGTIV